MEPEQPGDRHGAATSVQISMADPFSHDLELIRRNGDVRPGGRDQTNQAVISAGGWLPWNLRPKSWLYLARKDHSGQEPKCYNMMLTDYVMRP